MSWTSAWSRPSNTRETRERYLLLPDLAISCDGPVRSVMLFSKRPASELTSRRRPRQPKLDDQRRAARAAVRERLACQPPIRSRRCRSSRRRVDSSEDTDARLVIGDAALVLGSNHRERYPYVVRSR